MAVAVALSTTTVCAPLVDSRDGLCNLKRNEMRRKEKTSVLLYKTFFFEIILYKTFKRGRITHAVTGGFYFMIM